MATATQKREPHVFVDLDTERLQGWMNGAKDGAEKVQKLRALFAVAHNLVRDNEELVCFEPKDIVHVLDLIDGHLNDIEHAINDAVASMSMLKPNDALEERGTGPTLKVISSRKRKES